MANPQPVPSVGGFGKTYGDARVLDAVDHRRGELNDRARALFEMVDRSEGSAVRRRRVPR